MIRIFIGVDAREMVAYHVLVQSLIHHAASPLTITPLVRSTLRTVFSRERGPHDSTEFAISRFLVPMLCDFGGRAIFMDCDMLARADIGHLIEEVTSDPTLSHAAVCVVKHDYVPSTAKKFLNQPQTAYARKNWSSMMVFNNRLCGRLTRDYVERAPGLDLHQFVWAANDEIGEVGREWNCLIGEENQCDPHDAKLLHYTLGTPCFSEFAACRMAHEWHLARQQSQAPLAV